MADFLVNEIRTARARFMAADGVTEVAVDGDVTWTVSPAGAVEFSGGPGPSLTNPISMAVPTAGFVISASADADMGEGPDNLRTLTIASEPHNILANEAQGGDVVIE